MGEVALVVYVFLQQDAVSWYCYCYGVVLYVFMVQAFDSLRMLFDESISNYFEDVNLRNLIDFVQADVSSHPNVAIDATCPLSPLAVQMLWHHCT